MAHTGDVVTIGGVYRADCPHDVNTTRRFYPGEKFGPCPACPDRDSDRPDHQVTWTRVGP